MPRPSKAAGSVALVTGANRGIGPFMGGYSPAKAAALFLSSITRSELADQGTEVIALDALDRGEHVADTDFMAIDARARYSRDPARYERSMTKLLKATVMDTGR
jgi:hypothetical protein